MYEDEPWWEGLPANIKDSLNFYQWLVKTRAPILKIFHNFYKQENKERENAKESRCERNKAED